MKLSGIDSLWEMDRRSVWAEYFMAFKENFDHDLDAQWEAKWSFNESKIQNVYGRPKKICTLSTKTIEVPCICSIP